LTTADPSLLRLRGLPLADPFHVVLVEPEIPPNTGNIARLCGATGSPLHLVGPLGFRIDEHAVRRAGLDYWHLVDVHTHSDFASTQAALRLADQPRPFWLFTGRAARSVYETPFTPGDQLVFGKESVGLPEELLNRYPERCVAIPTLGAVRSLNLANSVSIALFEALRQSGAFATTRLA
jgi:tRNA (cytidine/uridine-2'-O-)-methyltransferase